jgi:hypothetical protein
MQLAAALTFGRKPGIDEDDELVLYATGTRRFFATARVTSAPYQHPHDKDSEWSWRVDIEILDSVPFIHQGARLDDLNVVDGRDQSVRIRRRSHVSLLPEEYAAAVTAIVDRRRRIRAA